MSSSSLNVDQRIVQMQFDNAQFEQGAATTMSTLEKLKSSLNFNGQNTGLDNLSKSVGKFNMAPMLSALDGARSKFSAMEVAAITVISNITSRVQAMGEQLVKAVTIDPVKMGWSEYEQKMDSIKTILNSAKDKNGAAVSLDQVKKKIEELNVYADKTIYSFADMTNNIGKFTNAGVDLDTSVAAIQGVANAAAAAGADSNAASRAMYNFAQSLSVGYMQRIDWKSIENANMATTEFKDQLLQTAVALGTVKKNSDGTYTSLTASGKKAQEASSAAAMFTEKLSSKWLTNDVLIKTLGKYSDTSTEIGKKAEEAATKVFTLSKMFDTLKEAMQSGWSATWEKIVGDYEQAGELFTGINDFISGAIGKRDQKRIDFLDDLLNKAQTVSEKDWDLFKADDSIKGLKTYKKVVMDVARKHGVSIDLMVQKNGGFKESLKKGWFTNDIFEDVNKYIKNIDKIKDKSGKPIYSEQEIKNLKAMTKSLKDSDSAYSKLGKSVDKTGRELAIESFKSLFSQVMKVYEQLHRVYEELFPPTTADQIYKVIQRIHDFATSFQVSITAIYRLKSVFRGILATFKIFKSVCKMIADIVLHLVKRLARFGEMVLNVGRRLGDMVDAMRKNIDKNKKFKKIVDTINDAIDKLFNKIDKFINGGSIKKENWLSFTDGLSKEDAKVYEKVVKRIAKEHGVNVDEMIKKNGSFAESLKEDWFTKDLFNEVNYYLEGINNKKRVGVKAIYTKDEYEALKRIRKSLDDTSSAYYNMGEAAGKSGAEIITGGITSIVEPLSGGLDKFIDVLPTILDIIGEIGKTLWNDIKMFGPFVWQLIKTVGAYIRKFILIALQKILEYGPIIYNTVKSIASWIYNKIVKYGPKIWNFVKNIFKTLKDIYGKVVKKLEPYMEPIKEFFKEIWEKAKELKKSIKNAFDKLKEFVEHALQLMNIEGVVGSIAGFFGDLAKLTFGALIKVVDKLTEFFTWLSSNKTVNKFFKSLGDVLLTIFTKIASGFSKVKEFVGKLLELEGVKNTIEKVKTFLSELGNLLSKKVGTGFENIKDFFSNLSDGLPTMETVLNTINGLLDGTVSKLGFVKDGAGKVFDFILGIFKPKAEMDMSDVEINSSNTNKVLDESGSEIKEGITGFVKNIEESMSSLNSTKILHAGAWVGLIFILFQVWRLFSNLVGLVKNAKVITSLNAKNPIVKFLNSISNGITAWRKQVDANIVYTIAKSIGILTVCMIALCALPTEKLVQVVAVLFWVMVGLSLVIRSIGKAFGASSGLEATSKGIHEAIGKFIDNLSDVVKRSLKLLTISGGIALIALGVFFIIKSLREMYLTITESEGNISALAGAAIALGIVLASLIGAMYILSRFKIDVSKGTALALLGMGVAINLLVRALNKMPKDDKKLDKGLGALVAMFIMLAGSLALLNWAAKGNGAELVTLAKSMIILAVAIDLLMVPLALLSLLPTGKVLGAASAMALVAVGLGILAAVSGEIKPQNAASILIMALAIRMLIAPLDELSKVKWVDLAKLGAVLLGFTVVAAIWGAIGQTFAMGLAAVGIAFAGFGVAVYLIVAAIGMIGPALDSLIDGIVSFSKKLVDNAGLIATAVVVFIGIICAAMLAKKALLEHTAFNMLLSLFSGIESALLACLPKSKILMAAALIALVMTVLGVADTLVPGVVDKLLGLLVKGLYAFAEGIINHSHGLVGAIFAVVEAIAILAFEIIVQLAELIDTALAGLFGGEEFFGPMLRDKLEGHKEEVLKQLDISKELDTVTEKNNASIDDYQESINRLNKEKEYTLTPGETPKPGKQPVTPTIPTKTPEEANQDGQKVGEAEAQGTHDGWISKMTSLFGGLDISEYTLPDGSIDITKIKATDLGEALTNGYDSGVDLTSITETELAGMTDAVGNSMSLDSWNELISGINETAEGVDVVTPIDNQLGEVDAKVEQLGEKVDEANGKANKETKKTEKITTEQDITVKAEINTDKADEAMTKAAAKTMKAYGTELKKQEEPMKTKLENIMKAVAKMADSSTIHTRMTAAGENAIQGLINGMDNKIHILKQKAAEAASITPKTVEKKQEIQSPSRVMFRLGDYSMQGFINGFGNRMDSLRKSSEEASGYITGGANDALGQLSRLLASDIDSTPTIRPVLDLSDVAKGARTINGMLGGSTLSVNSLSASRLSASMNSRQNGTDPVIAAINNLANNLSATPSNTYNINGITYDDGSNIANAIGMLTRAAIVEGRA